MTGPGKDEKRPTEGPTAIEDAELEQAAGGTYNPYVTVDYVEKAPAESQTRSETETTRTDSLQGKTP